VCIDEGILGKEVFTYPLQTSTYETEVNQGVHPKKIDGLSSRETFMDGTQINQLPLEKTIFVKASLPMGT